MQDKQNTFDRECESKLDATLADLESLKQRQMQHAERTIAQSRQWDKIKQSRLERMLRDVREAFDGYLDWVQDTMTLERQPWIKVLCVMTGEG